MNSDNEGFGTPESRDPAPESAPQPPPASAPQAPQSPPASAARPDGPPPPAGPPGPPPAEQPPTPAHHQDGAPAAHPAAAPYGTAGTTAGTTTGTTAGPAPGAAPPAGHGSLPPGGGHQPHGSSWSAFPPPPPPPAPRRRGLVAGVLAATLLAGGLGGGVGYLIADSTDTGNSSSTGNTSNGQDGSTGLTDRSPESVAGIADAALPSVVTIQAEGAREGGTGTGFVYDEEGHILTNNHVVAAAADGDGKLSVTFSDGDSYEAELVGGAQGYDIAVLRLLDTGGRDLQPLDLGDSDDVAVGDTTVAIGAPYGLSGTVTTGIVSAKNRPVASSDGMGGNSSYMSALQTDASINPGNSGGPLLNAAGAVIGVNSAIQSNSGGMGQQAGSIGLGFAIPVNQAKRVAQDLIESGEPTYAVIGVSVDMQQNSSAGATISSQNNGDNAAVDPEGPAGQVGLEPGDNIIQFGDRVIDSGPTLISEIWTYEPGDTVELTYVRDGRENTVDITLDARVGDQP